MPVIVKPASHGAKKVDWDEWQVYSAEALLSKSCGKEHERHFEKMVQSSFSSLEADGKKLTPSSNGFVLAAIKAYSGHHRLILRPEDIWFSVLSQLNFYINKNSEELRHLFVSHEGQKELEVVDGGSSDMYDFGKHAQTMTHMIAKNIKDPELRDWIMPDFSTTTKTDIVVASILMMGAMQKYFIYKMSLMCGIPSVKLLGTKEDWESILKKLDLLPSLGEQAAQFGKLLKPVVKRFVESFDHPDSAETKEFWQTIAHYSGGGSGPRYLSGWITAFCFWDNDGNCLFDEPTGNVFSNYFCNETQILRLDGVLYHRVDTDDVPQGYVSVPVKVNDQGVCYDAHMIAGSVAIDVSDSSKTGEVQNGKKSVKEMVMQLVSTQASFTGMDTLQPVSGWWMFKIKHAVESAEENKKLTC